MSACARLRPSIAVLGLILALNPLRATEASSPFDRLVAPDALALFNAVRPRMAVNLAQASAHPAAASATASSFRPSGGRVTIDALLHALLGNPDAEKSFRNEIEQGLSAYEQQAAAAGIANDVAGAMTLFLGAAELCSRGEEMTDAQSETVAHQLQAALDTPEMRAATDLQKQQLYEFFAAFSLYLLTTREALTNSHRESEYSRLQPVAEQALRWWAGGAPDTIVLDARGLALVAPVPAAPAVAPVAATEVVSLVGIWHGVGISSTFTTTPNASGTGVSSYGITNQLKGKDIAFLPDGWFTSVIPAGGLAGVDAAQSAQREPYYWGRYTCDGRHGTIQFVAGGPETFEFADGKIFFRKFEYAKRQDLK